MPSLESRIPDSICFSIKYSPKYFNGRDEIRRGLKSLTLWAIDLQGKTWEHVFSTGTAVEEFESKIKIPNILAGPLRILLKS